MLDVVLRPYQEKMMGDIRDAMRTHRRIAVRLQQGGGKSYLIAAMALRSMARGNQVLILSHRRQITAQNHGIFEDLGVKPQVITAKTKNISKDEMCNIAMSQTLMSRATKHEHVRELIRGCRVVLIDEGHLQWNDWIFDLVADDAYVIGFSGTWSRSGKQKQLGLLYDTIVSGISAPELISMGFIVPSECYGFDAPDLSDVDWDYHSGDWNQRQLAMKFRDSTRYGGIVNEWKRLAYNTKTLVYTTSSEHCVELCQEFRDGGIYAKYILSRPMPQTDDELSGTRSAVLREFESGGLKVLLNVDILGVGYNNPSIETVILDIATESYPNYSQKGARGGRPAAGKTHYTLLDFGDNVRKFGSPEYDRQQVLWHNELKGGGIASTKECPTCKRLIHLSYRICPFCGHKFLTEKEIYEVELVRIAEQVTQPTEKESLQSYVARCILDGRSTNWILVNICIKNAQNPKKAFMEAIEIMRTKHGKAISPQYWYFFKKNILKNKLKK